MAAREIAITAKDLCASRSQRNAPYNNNGNTAAASISPYAQRVYALTSMYGFTAYRMPASRAARGGNQFAASLRIVIAATINVSQTKTAGTVRHGRNSPSVPPTIHEAGG